jgi:DDE superfamily endonuclease
MDKVSDDPVLEEQPADIIGLYLNPPQHAAVFRVDEKAVVQGSHSSATPLPHSESHRRGMLSLLAAFELGIGDDWDDVASRHASADFVAFLTDIVVSQPHGKEIHVIADNLEAHKTVRVNEFLLAHRTVHLHFTPTYASWMSQVELWLSKIERDISVSGTPRPGLEMKRTLVRHIHDYGSAVKILKWKYHNPVRRIVIEPDGTIH